MTSIGFGELLVMAVICTVVVGLPLIILLVTVLTGRKRRDRRGSGGRGDRDRG